jgi:hypothetical protein
MRICLALLLAGAAVFGTLAVSAFFSPLCLPAAVLVERVLANPEDIR